MIQATRMTSIAAPALRFGNDPQVLSALQKIEGNLSNYDISVRRGYPTRSANTLTVTNKSTSSTVTIEADFMGRSCGITSGNQTFSTTDRAATSIASKLVDQFAPIGGGTKAKPDIDI
jgi:hypothetical protein